MRLNHKERQAIQSVFNTLDPDGHLFLFGSRADDARRGGDIDLFFEASRPLALKTILSAQYRLTDACDAKVDLLVKNPGEPETLIFQVAREGVRL